MTTQKPISKSPISDAFTGQSGYWWYGATCAAVFESAERFSKAQPPQGWHSPLLRRYRKEPQALHFTFTGKEKDPETGYSYFGARYLDHELMTMWLSVDPMADKYPSLSPYAYYAWNPVKLVDPDGRDGEAIVDKNKNTIDITMRFYYNKNDEKLQKYVFGMNPYEESQIEKDKENGFGSQKWSVVDYNDKEWTVTFLLNM